MPENGGVQSTAFEVLAATGRDRPRSRGPLRERGGRLRTSRDGRCWTSRRPSEWALERLMKHLELLTQQISLEHAGALTVVDEETLANLSDEKLAQLQAAYGVMESIVGGAAG